MAGAHVIHVNVFTVPGNVFWSGGPLLVVDQQRPVVDRKILKQIEVIIRSKENLQNTHYFFVNASISSIYLINIYS